MSEIETIEITAAQMNAVILHKKILGIHSVCNGNLIVVCTDGYLRMIEFSDRGKVVWLDSWS